ncbi:MAG: hypothetical protein VZR73_19080 [Acutalibacteraceae bacterium]|jgi:hypothetical protein|nr:hypothetical protein [Acutalibacteraceae bacterium]
MRRQLLRPVHKHPDETGVTGCRYDRHDDSVITVMFMKICRRNRLSAADIQTAIF